MANSDKSIQLVDIEKGEIAQFNSTDFNKDKIECLKYTNLSKDYENPNNLQSTVLSGGEDKLLKIWDRNSG